MSVAIEEFLRRSAVRVASKQAGLTVVLGNEGGDMDSVVGSIYLAMLLDSNEKYNCQPAVPAINFPLAELPLRNDIFQLFRELKIDTNLLLSVCVHDENGLDLEKLESRIVLYDHNKLKESQLSFGTLVSGVVDHHYDEGEYRDQTTDLRVIKTCGSACTLVAELYRNSGVVVPCPELLAAPIVLDTVNFDDAQKKVTPLDVDIFHWICSTGKLSDYDHTAVFSKLSTWKNDIFSLTVEQNLKRDYKFFAFPCGRRASPLACGIASVPCSFDEFVDKYTAENISTTCKSFTVENGLDAVIIAFAGKKDGVHSRQIAFCAPVETIDLFSEYAASAPSTIEFTVVNDSALSDAYRFLAYSLSDATVSRKRLVPSLSQYLKDGKESAL